MRDPVNKSIDDFLKKKNLNFSIKKNNNVTVITPTNSINNLNNILENFNRQDLKEKELIIIINNNKIDEYKWKNIVSEYENIKVYKLSENISLGRCLNFGIDNSKFDIIAKFDDDDYYGPKYLSDSIKAFDETNAKLIGKGATFVYMVGKKILTIRNPLEENKYTNFVNGSTLIFKKDVFKRVKFQDKNIAEDINFCDDCLKNRIKIYSTNRYHHVYFRYPNQSKHTWKIEDEKFLKLCCRPDQFEKHIENMDQLKSYVDIDCGDNKYEKRCE
ncbi:MAG: glycosyltransferase [Tissierellia bacterium]|nr:glycosyltransferase [Tissierellia bacterium]